jgi:ATP-binding cassette subfamily F protein 3
LGASLKIGYFAQAHEGLVAERSLMEEISSVVPQWLQSQIRDYLAKFLFTGEDVFKTVNLLSGGERGRLALAILALQGANLLLLDEPTNHLDLPSQEILQTMLAEFNGTILLVSHDRFLIDALATQIWEVVPDQSWLRIFEGSYSEYKAWLQKELAQENGKDQEKEQKTPVKSIKPEQNPGLSKNEMQRLQKRMMATEDKISQLEAAITNIELALQNPPEDAGKVVQLGQEYARLNSDLSEQMQAWEELAKQLE